MQVVGGAMATLRDPIIVRSSELLKRKFFKGREEVHKASISIYNKMETLGALNMY